MVTLPPDSVCSYYYDSVPQQRREREGTSTDCNSSCSLLPSLMLYPLSSLRKSINKGVVMSLEDSPPPSWVCEMERGRQNRAVRTHDNSPWS